MSLGPVMWCGSLPTQQQLHTVAGCKTVNIQKFKLCVHVPVLDDVSLKSNTTTKRATSYFLLFMFRSEIGKIRLSNCVEVSVICPCPPSKVSPC